MWQTILQVVAGVAPAVVGLFTNKQRTKIQEIKRVIELVDGGTIGADHAIDLIREIV